MEWMQEVAIPKARPAVPLDEKDKLRFYRFDFSGKLLSFEESISISPVLSPFQIFSRIGLLRVNFLCEFAFLFS